MPEQPEVGIELGNFEKSAKELNAILGNMNKQMRTQVKTFKELNAIQKTAVVTVKEHNKYGQQLNATFKITKERAYILKASITELNASISRSSKAWEKNRHEVAAYNDQKKKTIASERIHAIALQANIRFNERAAAATKRAASATIRASNASARVSAIHSKTVDTTKEMIKSQKDLILSTKGVERVLSILIIRRIFHQIITQMREAITTTMDLHKALTEIQTISQTAPSSLDKWADSIVRVSNAWDIGLLDAANARYQILSNQIAKTAGETERFQETASEFAKITKTTATSAVDLLSSALNAYGEAAVNADKVSAQLFKTIELGRIRSEDISSSFGRIVVIAAQLGIELAEVGAMMAIITNKGVKASEAMTLLRGVSMKLIKPTTDMKDLFAEWGVKTGEQAIATFGLLGVMQKLEEATRGSASEIGALMGRIRATMGVTAIVSDLEKFNDVLIQIRDTSKESYAKAAAMQFQTAGEKLSKELNLLKNTLVQGIGIEVVNVLADYNDGIVTITNTVIKLIDMATTLGITIGLIWSAKKLYAAALYLSMLRRHFITLGLLKVQTISAAAATEALIAVQAIASFGITIAIYATVTALRAMYKSAKETREALEDLDEQYQRFVANQISVIEKQRTEYEKSIEAFRAAGQQSLQQNAEIAAASNRMIIALEERIEAEKDWIAEHQDLVEQDIKFTIDEYTKMYNFLIKESERYSKQIEKVEKQRLRTSEDFANLIEKATREKYTPKENLKRLKEQEIQIKANRAASTGSMKEQKELIQEHKELAIDILSLEKSIKKVRDSSVAQQQADNARLRNRMLGIRGPIRKRKISDRAPEEALDTYIETMIELAAASEKIFQDELSTLEKFYSRAKELAAGVKDEYKEIAVLINQIMELLGKPTIKELGSKDIFEQNLIRLIKIDEVAFQAWYKRYAQLLKLDPNPDDPKHFYDYRKAFLAGAKPSEEGHWPSTFKLRGHPNLIVDGLDTRTGKPNIEEMARELVDKLNIIDPIQETIDVLKENQEVVKENTIALMKTIQIQTKEVSAAQVRGKEAENKITDSLTTLDETLEGFSIFVKSITKYQRWEKFFDEITETKLYDPTPTAMEQLYEFLQENIDVEKLTIEQKILYVESLKDLSNRLKEIPRLFLDEDFKTKEGTLYRYRNAQKLIESQIEIVQKAVDAWKKVNAELPALKENLAATTEMIKAIKTNAQMVGESLKLYELSIDELTNNQMVALREVINTFIMELTATTGALHQWGLDRKVRGQALGGSIWGTDTVPTRLTPGEFVVNQRSARKFYGQLVSMNAGGVGAIGGGDYSTTVGDLTISVQGGDTSRQTIQSIVSGIRREIYRGKLTGI